MALLVQKYKDPEKPGLLNYLNLHHDLVAIQQHMAAQKELPSIGSQKTMDQVPIIVSQINQFLVNSSTDCFHFLRYASILFVHIYFFVFKIYFYFP